jgi:hypothetical protein
MRRKQRSTTSYNEPQAVECDLCQKLRKGRRVYLRSWVEQDGRLRQAGWGTLDICEACLQTRVTKRDTGGRPRALRIHDAA